MPATQVHCVLKSVFLFVFCPMPFDLLVGDAISASAWHALTAAHGWRDGCRGSAHGIRLSATCSALLLIRAARPEHVRAWRLADLNPQRASRQLLRRPKHTEHPARSRKGRSALSAALQPSDPSAHTPQAAQAPANSPQHPEAATPATQPPARRHARFERNRVQANTTCGGSTQASSACSQQPAAAALAAPQPPGRPRGPATGLGAAGGCGPERS